MRASRSERRAREAALRLAALHEAGHCVMAETLGLPVTVAYVTGGGGGTWHRRADNAVDAATLTVSGVVAEALDRRGPQSPRSWDRQPDRADLSRSSPQTVSAAFQIAIRRLLSDPDTSAAVLALAGVLERRRLVTGWTVRRVLADPDRYPPRPPRRRNGPPDRDYVRRSLGA